MKSLLVITLSIVLFACQTDTTKEEYIRIVEAPGQENTTPEIETEEEKLMKNITTLSFNEMEHNFGKLVKDKQYYCEFEVENTGTFPLLITKVDASCGCTTPEKPDKPIEPGKKDKIKVGFKPGSTGNIEKTVTISANIKEQFVVLKIKAKVSE